MRLLMRMLFVAIVACYFAVVAGWPAFLAISVAMLVNKVAGFMFTINEPA